MSAETHVSEKETTTTAHHRKMPPGPRLKPLSMLSSLLFGSPPDLLGLYTSAARDFGDVVRFPGGPLTSYFFNYPDHIKHILQDNNHNYSKQHRVTDLLKPFVGEGLLTSDGDIWRRRRRLAQPAFHRQRLALLATLMTEATQEMLRRWESTAQSRQPFDIVLEMQRVAMTIVGRALFHTEVGDEVEDIRRRSQVFMEYFNHRSRRLLSLPVSVPTRRNRRVRQAMRESDAIVYRLIQERRQSSADRGDLLSMLLAARDEETGEGLSDKEVRDEVQTFLGAGNETTAVTLAWVWYLLSRHPEVERTLRAELKVVLAGRVPTFADLPRLTYTRMIIDETLRLYPPAWAMARSAIGEDEVGGYHIPAKALVILSPYVTQRRADVWENPEGFDPERFTPDQTAHRPRYAYFPFGGGPRQCIGNEFALMEATLVLATVAQHYRLHLVSGHPVEPYPIFTLRPRHGLLMTVQHVAE